MTDIVDRLKDRCWPLDKRDELCMDAVYVITDLRARLAEAEALLELAQGEHYCGPETECVSPFCVAMRKAGKPFTQPEFVAKLEADSASVEGEK